MKSKGDTRLDQRSCTFGAIDNSLDIVRDYYIGFYLGGYRSIRKIMTNEELTQLIEEVQKRQSEFDHVEVKAARHGTPKRLYKPMSAFANRSGGGGVILFGLDRLGSDHIK